VVLLECRHDKVLGDGRAEERLPLVAVRLELEHDLLTEHVDDNFRAQLGSLSRYANLGHLAQVKLAGAAAHGGVLEVADVVALDREVAALLALAERLAAVALLAPSCKGGCRSHAVRTMRRIDLFLEPRDLKNKIKK